MQLQRLVNRRRGERVYYKFSLTIPSDVVSELGWAQGDEISFATHGTRLELRRGRKATGLEAEQKPP